MEGKSHAKLMGNTRRFRWPCKSFFLQRFLTPQVKGQARCTMLAARRNPISISKESTATGT
jgi:hypothetical protein